MYSSNRVRGKKTASLRDKQVRLPLLGLADVRSLYVLPSTNERSRRIDDLCFRCRNTVYGLMYISLGIHPVDHHPDPQSVLNEVKVYISMVYSLEVTRSSTLSLWLGGEGCRLFATG
jgi:hypothetical protein